MYIDKKIFGECYCPKPGFAGIRLKRKELPNKLIKFQNELEELCRFDCYIPTIIIEIIDGEVDDSWITYISEDYSKTEPLGDDLDNWKEAWEYYKKYASQEDYECTMAEELKFYRDEYDDNDNEVWECGNE